MSDFVPDANPAAQSPKLDAGPLRGNPLRAAWRVLVWWSAMARFGAGMLADRARGQASAVRDATRLRLMLEHMGPSAIKLGQQMSIRTDLIPKEYSDALMGLLDAVPPFSFDQARTLIERELRRPMEGLFRKFDPEPIGSASIACVFKAQLHSGESVAVKVRRPEVVDVLVSDLTAISWICRFFEILGLMDPGRSRPVLDEFTRMLLDELNFKVEARQTELFRQYARKGNRYATAPAVFREFTTSGILVTEFIDGVFLRQIIAAIERDDKPFLDNLAAQGYLLPRVARRLMNIFYWQLFENVFFHADPHPSNVVIRQNQIVFIDFGATGTITRKYSRDLMRFVRALADDNIDGMVRHMIASLEPLPPLNLEAYTNEMHHAMREYLFTARSPYSTWQERSSGRAMMALTEISSKYGIPMRADVLRYMRASFQFDSIVYRLDPTLDSKKVFREYLRQRAKRARKKSEKGWKKVRKAGIGVTVRTMAGELMERLGDVDTVLSFVAKHTTQLEALFQRRVSAKSRILAWLMSIVRLAGSGAAIAVLWTWSRQHYPDSLFCRSLNNLFGFFFGPEVGTALDHLPALSERLWMWILAGLVVSLASVSALIRGLRTPASKLE